MAIVDLKSRLSSRRDKCEASKMSAESLIYIDTNVDIAESNPMSIDLKVGEICLLPGDSRTYRIDEQGIKVKPRQSVVIYSKEKFVLPLNVFGLVTGKGTYIFQGCMVASGKIDPGYRGNLKVCFFNGGRSSVTIKPGDVFCTVFFMDGDCTLMSPLVDYQENPNPILADLSWYLLLWNWLKANWYNFIVSIGTIAAVIISLISLISRQNDSGIGKSEGIDRTNFTSSINGIR